MAREHHFHTLKDVRSYLDEARKLIEELQLPLDLREVAFGKAVDLLQAKQVFFDQADAAGGVARALAGAIEVPRI